MRYEVKKVDINHVGRFWTVIAWDGERCLGGDHHWLEEWMADEARLAYEAGTARHGDTSRIVMTARGRL